MIILGVKLPTDAMMLRKKKGKMKKKRRNQPMNSKLEVIELTPTIIYLHRLA